MTNLVPGQAATHDVGGLCEIALGFLTGNELSPSTRDLFIVEGAWVSDWADEDERVEIIRDVVRKYLMEPRDGRGNIAYLTTPEFMALVADWKARSGDNIVYAAVGNDVLLLHPWHRQQLMFCESELDALRYADELNDRLASVPVAE